MFLNFKKRAGGLLLLVLGFMACDKEPQYQSPQKFLTQAPWRVVADSLITYKTGQPTDTEDLQANVPPCVQDNLIFFDADGVYRQEEGALKCNDSTPQGTELGRWNYDPIKKELLLDGAGRLEWEVLQLNDTLLQLFLETTYSDVTDTIRRARTRAYKHPAQ